MRVENMLLTFTVKHDLKIILFYYVYFFTTLIVFPSILFVPFYYETVHTIFLCVDGFFNII